MEVLAEARRENRELGLLRRRELELMKKANPANVVELASQPEQPAGRENLDKQAKEDPTMVNLAEWDWRIELLEDHRRRAAERVWRKMSLGMFSVCEPISELSSLVISCLF